MNKFIIFFAALVAVAVAIAANTTTRVMDNLILREPSGTNSISVVAPSGFSTNYTFTLPGTVGIAGQALTTNGTGTLSWTSFLGATDPATLTNKVLTAPIINNGTISGAVLSGGTLAGALSSTGTITGGQYTSAQITNGTITGGALSSSSFTTGTISSSSISSVTITNGTLTSPVSTQPSITGGTLTGSLISSASITNGTLTGATVTGGSFSDGTLAVSVLTEQGSTPSNPSSGFRKFYVKTDGKAYLLNASGTETELGSGAGGDATNLLTNASYESGTTGHSLPAGTAAISTTDLVQGTQGLRFSLSSVSGTIIEQSLAPTGSFGGVNLESSLWVKTTVGSLEVCATQGTTAVSCNDVPAVGAWTQVTANAAGPTSGSLGYRLRTKNSVAVTGTVAVDYAYTGIARNTAPVAQAQLWGAISYTGTANCVWTTTSSSYANFAADTDCPTPTVTGNAIAPATKVPGLSFSSLPPGRYYIVAQTGVNNGLTGGYVGLRFSDGTNSTPGSVMGAASGLPMVPVISGFMEVTSAQSFGTLQIQAAAVGGGTVSVVANSTSPNYGFSMQVYRFPTANETAVRPDQLGWYVDANIGGTNIDLGGTAISTYAGIENTLLTVKPRAGSAPVGAVCSATNAATTPSTSNTECIAGSESVGINFTIPRPGAYQACVDIIHYASVSGASGLLDQIFQVYETPTNAQTATSAGGSKVNSIIATVGTGTLVHANPARVCGVFNWADAGRKAVRLFREQGFTGTLNSNLILADEASANGDRDIRWTVFPITGAMPSPLLVGSVTSNSQGMERIERAKINVTSASACSVTSESGDWLGTCTASSSTATIPINAGIFSGTPTCVATCFPASTANCLTRIGAASSSSLSIVSANASTAAAVNEPFELICMGPK